MADTTNGKATPVSPDLLEILRDPQAIQEGTKYGPDPGRLELVNDYWLVSADTGYKYPIRDGIPVMLVEEGAKWKDTPVDALPVPPPAPAPEPATVAAAQAETSAAATTTIPPFVIIAGIGALLSLLLLVLYLLGRRQTTPASDQLPSP